MKGMIMKRMYLCFLVSIALTVTVSAKVKLEPVPVTIDYKGAVTRNDTIIAYGTLGSMHIGIGEKWEQRSVFLKGNIEALFWEDNRMAAFNDFGDVAVSGDNGRTWDVKHRFDDSVLSVLAYSGGYLIRSINRIFTINNSFEVIKETQLYTKSGTYKSAPLYYRHSTVFFKDNFIVEADGANFLRYNKNLEFIDTISFSKLGLCTSFGSGHQLRTDSDYIYTLINSKIFRSNDLIHWDTIFTCKGNSNLYKSIDGQLLAVEINYKNQPFNLSAYRINDNDMDSILKLGDFESEYAAYPEITDMVMQGQNVYVFGINNNIILINKNDSSMKVISELTSFSKYYTTQNLKQFNNSTNFLMCNNLLYNNDNIIFTPLINYSNNTDYIKLNKINFYYFDDVEKTIYLGGTKGENATEGVYISDNYGESFKFNPTPSYYFSLTDPLYPFYKLAVYPLPVQKRENCFITSCYTIYSKTVFTKILTFDNYFNLISYFIDTTYAIDFVDSKDTNSFLVHCLNVKDNTYEIKYTTNKGQNWEMIKKYSEPDSMFFFNDLQIKGKRVLAMFIYNPTDSMYTVEALDVEKRAVNEIYKYKILSPDKFTSRINGICVENDTVYLAIDDTIFYTSDIYNRSKWQYYLLPNNGRIMRTFQKFGNRFWTSYMDKNFTRRTFAENNLFWLKIVNDSTVNVVDSETKSDETYLYIYPPKPTPSTNHVRTLIYFDPKIEFDLNKVGITDVTGAKIEGSENISLDRLSPYSGYLNWNCSRVGNGVYFIHIRHGNNARVVKVIVSR